MVLRLRTQKALHHLIILHMRIIMMTKRMDGRCPIFTMKRKCKNNHNLKSYPSFFKRLCQSETSVVFEIRFLHFAIFTDTWKTVFMLKIRWTAWQDQMLACMVDKYHKAKYQMAQKMISMTASEDMLTKEKNLVRGSERKYTTRIMKYYIDSSIV